MDRNAELINCFKVIRDDLDALMPILIKHQTSHSDNHYYRVRESNPCDLTAVERAARLIYLNKTCYNGLYRVNSSGRFNVPVGSYVRPKIFDEPNLVSVSGALRGAELLVSDFSAIADIVAQGDFVYLDPPYYTETTGFTSYAVGAGGRASFGAYEHQRLSNLVHRFVGRGCHVVLSNSDTNYVRRLYRGLSRNVVTARRLINCDGTGRRPINELVITSACPA